jgi:hypothetical protein
MPLPCDQCKNRMIVKLIHFCWRFVRKIGPNGGEIQTCADWERQIGGDRCECFRPKE